MTEKIIYGIIFTKLLDGTTKAPLPYLPDFADGCCVEGRLIGCLRHAGEGSGICEVASKENAYQEWLRDVGLEMPNTLDEFVNVARAFKEKDPGNVGANLVPIIDNQNKIKDYIWNALGFYASNGGQTYGTNFAVKNEKLVLPAYSAEAKLFLETMNTLYTEGLVSRDYFTLDQTANRGIVSEGRCGIFGDSTLQPAENNWQAWWALSPLSSSVNDLRVASTNFGYSIGGSFSSADTKYPELVAAITDFMYSDYAAMLYQRGAMKGTEEAELDPYPWYIEEDNTITNDLVKSNSTYRLTNYHAANYYIAGKFDNFEQFMYDYANTGYKVPTRVIKDKITGREVDAPVTTEAIFNDSNWDQRWRVSQTSAMADYLTFIRLPSVYLSMEQEEEVTDLRMVLEDYITQETPKFITGARSLDEFDAYQEELKNLGVERYIEIYTEAYASFLDATFGK